MGACGSRPKTVEGDAPVDLPATRSTPVTTSEVTPAEAGATTEVTTESSESMEERAEEKEAPLVNLSEPKAEEPKSEEVATEAKVEEEIVAPEETKGEPEEEALIDTGLGNITEEVAKESEEKVAIEAKQPQAQEMQ